VNGPRLTRVSVYPVKSCRGHDVAAAEVDAWGFRDDRRFLVVTPEGRFLTQRELPRMALVETALTAATLTLASPGRGAVEVPRAPDASPQRRRVTVWSSTVEADDCGEPAAEWLTRCLGVPARLVRMGAAYDRPVKPSRAQPGDVVSFADGYPFLLLGEESLDDLNDRLVAAGEEPVPADRFRANLWIRGGGPFAEDALGRFRLGALTLRHAGPCARCVVTTTDQATAERGKEPLRTLALYRRDPAKPGDVNFGVNLIHETKTGTLRVGDLLKPL
jgi:uncharacterized protein